MAEYLFFLSFVVSYGTCMDKDGMALRFKVAIFFRAIIQNAIFCDSPLHVLTLQFNEAILLEHEYKIAVGR